MGIYRHSLEEKQGEGIIRKKFWEKEFIVREVRRRHLKVLGRHLLALIMINKEYLQIPAKPNSN